MKEAAVAQADSAGQRCSAAPCAPAAVAAVHGPSAVAAALDERQAASLDELAVPHAAVGPGAAAAQDAAEPDGGAARPVSFAQPDSPERLVRAAAGRAVRPPLYRRSVRSTRSTKLCSPTGQRALSSCALFPSRLRRGALTGLIATKCA